MSMFNAKKGIDNVGGEKAVKFVRVWCEEDATRTTIGANKITINLLDEIKKLHEKGLDGCQLPVQLRDADNYDEWKEKHPDLIDPCSRQGIVHYLLVNHFQDCLAKVRAAKERKSGKKSTTKAAGSKKQQQTDEDNGDEDNGDDQSLAEGDEQQPPLASPEV